MDALETRSQGTSTHASEPHRKLPHPFIIAVPQSANDHESTIQHDAENAHNTQIKSLSSDHTASFATISSTAAPYKEGSQSSDSNLPYVDHYRDAGTSQAAAIPPHPFPYSTSSATQSADTVLSPQINLHPESTPPNKVDDAEAANAQLKAQDRVLSVTYALDQPAKTRNPQKNLRTKLSRLFGPRRTPRAERPKSLSRPALNPQAAVVKDHLQIPPADPTSQIHHRHTIKHSASAPVVSCLAHPGPRFIGLQDRLAKEPIAVPTFVRRVDFRLPTDQTMATRGSSSGASRVGYVSLGDEGAGKTRTGSRPDSQASIRTLIGDKQRRSIWSRIKGKAKKVFGRGDL